MQWQQRIAPVDYTRHADISMRQGEPSVFFVLVGTGSWANDSVQKMRYLETEAVDERKFFSEGRIMCFPAGAG